MIHQQFRNQSHLAQASSSEDQYHQLSKPLIDFTKTRTFCATNLIFNLSINLTLSLYFSR